MTAPLVARDADLLRSESRLVAPEKKREAVERAHTHHVPACGVARSLGAALDISTTLELVPPRGDRSDA